MTATAEHVGSDERHTINDDIAHYFLREDLLVAAVTGVPIEALCGVVLVPTRDPSGMPICKACDRQLRRLAAARAGLN